MTAGASRQGHGAKRERQHERLIAALLTAPSYEAAARGCGLSEATVYRWLKDPSFKAAFRAARREVVEAAIGRLQRASVAAVDTLERATRCRSATVRVSAART